MSTTQVGQGLEAHGVQTSKPVHFNLSAAALYEHAIRRQEGLLAQEGPLVCRTGAHTGRSPNDKFVVKEPSSEAARGLGQGQQADRRRRTSTRCAATSSRTSRARSCSSRTCYAGADPEYRLPVRFIHELAWQNLFVRNLFIVPTDRPSWPSFQPQFTVMTRAVVQGRSGAARHALRRRHRRQPRDARSADLRHQLRRREQEVDLHRPQLPAAAAGRAVDALLGQHRRGRRHGAVLRPVGHRQDDAVERSRAPADRRRRARLERSRRVQLRRRLLRQDDPLSAEAEPQIYATTRRFGTVLENVVIDPDTRALDLDDASLTENTRGAYPIDVHRQRRAVGHAAAIRRTS